MIIRNMENMVLSAPISVAAGERLIAGTLPVWPVGADPMGFMGMVDSPVYPAPDSWLLPWLRDDVRAILDDFSAMVGLRVFLERNDVEIPSAFSVREKMRFVRERHSGLLDESYEIRCGILGGQIRFLLAWGFFGMPGDISAFVNCRVKEGERELSAFPLSGCGVWDSSIDGLREALSMALRSGLGAGDESRRC